MILTAGATRTTGTEETAINALTKATTRGIFSQGVDTTEVIMETLIGAEEAATEVIALVSFVGQRGIEPSNAPRRHKHQRYPPGDVVNPMPYKIGHHQ